MKKFLLLLLFILSVTAHSQEHVRCGTAEYEKALMDADPALAKKRADFDAMTSGYAQRNIQDNTIYTIPLVIHVMHKGEPVGTGSNLSDEVIMNHIKVLNERFRKVTGSLGDGQGVDTQIQFALASRSNTGQCTTGVDRVNMSGNAAYMNHGVYYSNPSALSMSDLVMASSWNTAKYLNIYLVSEFDSGANPIAGISLAQAVIMLKSNFEDPFDDTLVHEVGHHLSLYHTFEGGSITACPPVQNGCGYGIGDCCSDTPPHKTAEVCSITTNSCANNSTDISFTRNYLTYGDSSCHNMFTGQQRDRMIAYLTTNFPSYLTSNGNTSLISPSAPVADFKLASGGVSCSSGTVKLVDQTACSSNTYIFNGHMPGTTFLWTISNGVNTYTSTAQNPEFTAQAGVYNVTLTVTNQSGTNTRTKNNFLLVAQSPGIPCTPASTYDMEFDLVVNKVSFNSISNVTNRRKGGPYLNFSCNHNTVVVAGQSYPISVSTKANGSDPISFIILIDYDNNGVFTYNEIVFNGSNPGNIDQTFTGNISIPATAVKNHLLTMRVIGAGFQVGVPGTSLTCSQPLLIGDVEDYGVYIVANTPAGVQDFTKHNITLSPNPVVSILNVSANTIIESLVIYNMLGQQVHSAKLMAAQAAINVSSLSAGTYVVHAISEGRATTLKIIKQ
jgi:PKD repeat protein